MALLRAVTGADGSVNFSPYPYTPRVVADGPELAEDFAIYAALTAKCLSMPPTAPMLLFAGEPGMTLFLRRAATPEAWRMFRNAFKDRFPNIGRRLEVASNALATMVTPFKNGRLPSLSFPQIVFGCALKAVLPRTVRLRIEAPLAAPFSQSRSDFELASPHGDLMRLEICGMLSRTHGALTKDGHKYAARRTERLERYTKAGLPAPLFVYADDIFDVARLKALTSEAFRTLMPDGFMESSHHLPSLCARYRDPSSCGLGPSAIPARGGETQSAGLPGSEWTELPRHDCR